MPVNFLTDFADEAVILPLFVVIGLTLLTLGWRRGALAWTVALAGTLAVVLVLKGAGIACGPPLLRSPSGHTAAAAVVCGGLATLLLRWPRLGSVILAALAGATMIGLSRLALGMHTLPEVLAGGVVGLGFAVLLRRFAGPRPAALRIRWLIVAATAVVVLFHGLRLPAEARIRAAALATAGRFRVCRGAAGPVQERPYVSSSRTMSSSPR